MSIVSTFEISARFRCFNRYLDYFLTIMPSEKNASIRYVEKKIAELENSVKANRARNQQLDEQRVCVRYQQRQLRAKRRHAEPHSRTQTHRRRGPPREHDVDPVRRPDHAPTPEQRDQYNTTSVRPEHPARSAQPREYHGAAFFHRRCFSIEKPRVCTVLQWDLRRRIAEPTTAEKSGVRSERTDKTTKPQQALRPKQPTV